MPEKEPKYLWKSLSDGLQSYHGKKKWEIGKWYKCKGTLEICQNGFHASEKIIDAMGDQSIVVGNGKVIMRRTDHHMILNIVIAEVVHGQLLQKKYVGPVSPSDQCANRMMS